MSEKQVDMRGKVYEFRGLVEYHEGSVVSRTIIDKDVGTVTLFAFDDGEGLSEHTAPYDALVVDLEGEVEIRIAGKKSLLKEGDMIIMPPNKSHALKALTRFKMMLVMIRAD